MVNGVQAAFKKFYEDFQKVYHPSREQDRAAFSIMSCKTGVLGANVSICDECNHIVFHNNSCRNRHCPSCQAISREVWIDNRNSEIIDASYFHAVFTVPFELNDIFYANQSVMYSAFHSAVSKTLLQLSADKKHLGAAPGIIQVLHTWGQELNYHPHIHCIITGAGLTKDFRFVKGKKGFFIPVRVLSRAFRGIFINNLKNLFEANSLVFPRKLSRLKNAGERDNFINSLYRKEWFPFIKETFNNFGNAVEYLGRYAHRIAISNSRIISVSDDGVTFSAKDYRDNSTKIITLSGVEFIRRFLAHVLPTGFQKIRYAGFLNNRCKSKNLKIIRRITGKFFSKGRLAGLNTAEVIAAIWGVNTRICPVCNCASLRSRGIRVERR